MAKQSYASLSEALRAVPWMEPEAFARLVHAEAGCSVKEFRRRRYKEQMEELRRARKEAK